MWKILVCVFLIQHFATVSSSVKFVGLIRNVSLVMFNTNSTIINGTCHECVCVLLLNTTSFSFFICFQNSNICEMFSEPLKTGSFTFVNNSASLFYFFSLPIDDTTLTISNCHYSFFLHQVREIC